MADFIVYYRESTDGESALGLVAGKFTEKIQSGPHCHGVAAEVDATGPRMFSAPPPAPGQ